MIFWWNGLGTLCSSPRSSCVVAPAALLMVCLAQTTVLAQSPWKAAHEKPGRVVLSQPAKVNPPVDSPVETVQTVAHQFEVPVPVLATELNPNDGVLEQIDPQRTLTIHRGRPSIFRLKQIPFRDQVTDPDTLDVLGITETEYSITGKEVGTSVLNFWFNNPNAPGGQELVSYLVRVLEDPEIVERYQILLEGLQKSINREFPNSAVQLSYVGNQVVVRGQAKDIEQASHILNIVSRSLPKEDQLDQPFNPENFFIAGAGPSEIAAAGGIDGLLQGQTGTGVNGARINNRIVNLLEVGGLHQVMLKVTVAEVNRSATRAIGADFSIGSVGDAASFFSIFSPVNQLGMIGNGATLLVDRTDFDLAINALKTLNLARTLATPTLTTLNGQSAQMQVGGSFPIPQVTGATATGLQGVEFQPFGVNLQFLPTVTDGDRIRLNMQASVSTRDESTGTTVGDSDVSGLTDRNFSTTVELREGMTLAVGGLIQSNLGGTSSRVPFAGDVPFLGRMFSSDTTSYDEQELIVLVTPYLVNPVDANAELPPIPGSDYFEPDDLEFFVRGSLTGHIAEDFRTPARTDIHQIKAFRRLEQELIIGQPGHSNGLLCPSLETKVHP